MTGAEIGTAILGVLTSGFTFVNVDAQCQEIIKGAVMIAAVITDQYRRRKRCKARASAAPDAGIEYGPGARGTAR